MATMQLREKISRQSPLESYFREVNQTPLLSHEEERELAYRIADGENEARDEMVRANLRLVVRIAKGFLGRGVPLQDLIEEGNLGLLHAAERFDPEKNVRFSTYASFWIKQSIIRAIMNSGKTVRLPCYMVNLVHQWRRATSEMQEELGRVPTQEEVGEHLGMSKKKLRVIQKAIRIYQAGSDLEGDDNNLGMDEILVDTNTPTPDAMLSANDEMRQVLKLLDEMSDERERAVLRLRFGLDGNEPMTLNEIGTKLNLTRERVRQIERTALARLREKMVTD